MNKKICFLLLIILGITFKTQSQFVPFKSGHFVHLNTDTLYNLTGCDTPRTTPNSYKRIVWYYDSCLHQNWYWAPESHAWIAFNSGAGLNGFGYVWQIGTTSTFVPQIPNADLVNSSITINGTSIALGASGTITANTPNALTFNNSGTGDASGTTFNGSAARTLSYNSIGAASQTALIDTAAAIRGDFPTSGALLPTSGTGTATADVTGDINGNELKVNNGATNFLDINAISGHESSVLTAADGIGTNQIVVSSNASDGYLIALVANNGANTVQLIGDAVANSIGYTAGSHTFSGNMFNTGLTTADVGDSVIMWNSGTGQFQMKDAASFGGGSTPDLQAVTDIAFSTTNQIESSNHFGITIKSPTNAALVEMSANSDDTQGALTIYNSNDATKTVHSYDNIYKETDPDAHTGFTYTYPDATGIIGLWIQYTPTGSTDTTYPPGTFTEDDTNLYYETSDGTWVKIPWQTF